MIVERLICDLCWWEKGRQRIATHQYTAPYLDGYWMDGCREHTNEMRVGGGHEIRKVQQPDPETD